MKRKDSFAVYVNGNRVSGYFRKKERGLERASELKGILVSKLYGVIYNHGVIVPGF